MNNVGHNGNRVDEIIQIGAVKCNEDYKEIGRFNSYVRSREPVKRYITKLTGIDNDTLCKAKYFSKVGSSFLDWVWSNEQDHEIEFIEWGTNDKKAFDQCCEYYKISSDKTRGIHWTNIQPAVTKELTLLKKQLQLQDAIVMTGLKLDGWAHDAGFDAVNTYKLLKHRHQDPDYFGYTLEGDPDRKRAEIAIVIDRVTNKIEHTEENITKYNKLLEHSQCAETTRERVTGQLAQANDKIRVLNDRLNELTAELKLL